MISSIWQIKLDYYVSSNYLSVTLSKNGSANYRVAIFVEYLFLDQRAVVLPLIKMSINSRRHENAPADLISTPS